MTGRVDHQPKFTGETSSYTVDFVDKIPSGQTISTQVVTASVYSGTDASPSAIISGSATASGTQVTQKLTAGTIGVTYELTWTITTSGSLTLIKTGYLSIVPKLV